MHPSAAAPGGILDNKLGKGEKRACQQTKRVTQVRQQLNERLVSSSQGRRLPVEAGTLLEAKPDTAPWSSKAPPLEPHGNKNTGASPGSGHVRVCAKPRAEGKMIINLLGGQTIGQMRQEKVQPSGAHTHWGEGPSAIPLRQKCIPGGEKGARVQRGKKDP